MLRRFKRMADASPPSAFFRGQLNTRTISQTVGALKSSALPQQRRYSPIFASSSSLSVGLRTASTSRVLVAQLQQQQQPRRSFFFADQTGAGSSSSATAAPALPDKALSQVIPFRLSPRDSMQAYARFMWEKTPFLKPRAPKRLQAVFVPFWVFDCDVTVTTTSTSSSSGSGANDQQPQQERRSEQVLVYGGYEFNRAMVDIVKLPPAYATTWDPRYLLLPKNDVLDIDVHLPHLPSHRTSRSRRAQDESTVNGKNGSSSSDASTASSSSSSWLGDLFRRRAEAPDPPHIKGIELDPFAMFETTAWSHAQTNIRAIVQNELNATMNGSRRSSSNNANARRIESIDFSNVCSRRIYAPAYVVKYRHIGRDFRVFINAVTGETFGLQQFAVSEMLNSMRAAILGIPSAIVATTQKIATSAPLDDSVSSSSSSSSGGSGGGSVGGGGSAIPRARRSSRELLEPFRHAETGAQYTTAAFFASTIASVVFRKLLFIPVVAVTSFFSALGLSLYLKLSPHRQHSASEREWAKLKADEMAFQAHMSDQWLFKVSAMQQHENARAARAMWDSVAEQQRRVIEARERVERVKLARTLPPPPIPADLYEVLGLPVPRSRAAAAAVTLGEIRNGFRRQALIYHPDTWSEESSEFPKEYSHKRMQAVTTAYSTLANAKKKQEWDDSRYP